MARYCANRRRALHARIAETLESQFAEIVELTLNSWRGIR